IGGAAHLVTDFAQAVFKIKGLAKMLSEDKDQLVIKRIQALDLARSIARLVPIDENEEFERKPTPITGLPDLLDRLRDELIAAADIPEKILFGKATAGLGDQGQSDLEQYYNSIEGEQERNLLPQAKQLVTYLLAEQKMTPPSWDVLPQPLWTPSDKEISENRLRDAQADELRIRSSTLTSDEIRNSRYGGDGYGTELAIEEEPGSMDGTSTGEVQEVTGVVINAALAVFEKLVSGSITEAAARTLLRASLRLEEPDIDAMLEGWEEAKAEAEKKAAEMQQRLQAADPNAPGAGGDPKKPQPGKKAPNGQENPQG
ncbi:MAG TPA: anti-CBASS Acb1 family protein, partial [Thermoanaerobaculia bacterium]|nr:anti-CBASS Acb1 family protein [Thermoanaerobaculia bacterium]